MLNMLKKKWETWTWWEAKRKVFKRESEKEFLEMKIKSSETKNILTRLRAD